MIDNFRKEYGFLSNFSTAVVVFEGLTYPTTENAFQAAKCKNVEDRATFTGIEPTAAKSMGRTVELRSDWKDVQDDIMYQLLKSKFSINWLKKKLLATGEEEIVEGNWWHDNYWGVCNCDKCSGKGKNILGKMLMRIREEIRKGETGANQEDVPADFSFYLHNINK